MQDITYFSPAKINLFLHITGKRDDGYHNLQSVFTALDFGDYLTFCPATDDTPITLIGADSLTDDINDNLIIKAVKALADRYPAHATPVCIHLDKRLPTGAGLGGGSSNCATTLIALNALWKLHLTPDELIHIGATLGADVPFFIFAHAHQCSAIATGKGEQLSPIALPPRRYLLLLPATHISTQSLFAHPHLTKNTPLMDATALHGQTFDKLTPDFFNAFEPIVKHENPNIAHALDYLNDIAHRLGDHATPRMTGTGSAVFLPIISPSDDMLMDWIANAPCPAVLTSSLYGN